MPKKGQGALRGGVTDGDTVNVPIQKKEGDTRLVLTVRASELTLDRGDVAASSTIEFRCLRTDVARTGKLQLTHALAGGEREVTHECLDEGRRHASAKSCSFMDGVFQEV